MSKQFRDKEHDYENEFPAWAGYIGIAASCALSLLCAYFLEIRA